MLVKSCLTTIVKNTWGSGLQHRRLFSIFKLQKSKVPPTITLTPTLQEFSSPSILEPFKSLFSSEFEQENNKILDQKEPSSIFEVKESANLPPYATMLTKTSTNGQPDSTIIILGMDIKPKHVQDYEGRYHDNVRSQTDAISFLKLHKPEFIVFQLCEYRAFGPYQKYSLYYDYNDGKEFKRVFEETKTIPNSEFILGIVSNKISLIARKYYLKAHYAYVFRIKQIANFE